MRRNAWWILVILVVGISVFLFTEKGGDAPAAAVSSDASEAYAPPADSTVTVIKKINDTLGEGPMGAAINTGNTSPQEVVAFAQTLVGTPYRYASTDPSIGFDCSGFITYVFHHFNIEVPRSSIDFTGVGKEVSQSGALPGDLVLFTGTDSTEKFVGHMGMVVSNDGSQLTFIHSSSGKAKGVTLTPLNDYYHSRYVKTIRVFTSR